MNKHLDFRSMASYGLIPLTGERCPYYLRLLWDVNKEGLSLLEKFFCIPLKLNPTIKTLIANIVAKNMTAVKEGSTDTLHKEEERILMNFIASPSYLPESWNYGSEVSPSIGSIMFPESFVHDILLYIAFHVENAYAVIDLGDCLILLEKDSEYLKENENGVRMVDIIWADKSVRQAESIYVYENDHPVYINKDKKDNTKLRIGYTVKFGDCIKYNPTYNRAQNVNVHQFTGRSE